MIKYRYCRENCVRRDNYFIKDLRVLGKELESCIAVDNSIIPYMMQLDNLIPIKPFLGECNDIELINITSFLKSIQKYKDVRVPIKERYMLSSIQRHLINIDKK